jgi:hypothetical protein
MRIRTAAAAFAAALVVSSTATAQTAAVSLQPADPPRWDVAGHAGWFGGNKSEIAPDWNDWYDAALGGVSVGYYWTPHLKLEVDVFTTTTGDLYTEEQIPIPGQIYPLYRRRQLYFRETGVSAGVSYQFLENTWFHPFVGGGIEAARETSRVETPFQYQPSPIPGPPVIVPGDPSRRDTTGQARPFLTAGFKWYVTPRAFVRSELRSSWSSAHAETTVWRGGVGVDF